MTNDHNINKPALVGNSVDLPATSKHFLSFFLLQAVEVMRQMNGVTHPWALEFIHYSQSNSCYHAGDSSVSYAAGVLHQKAQ